MYLLFVKGKENYGDQETLESHLSYLRKNLGSPDAWSTADTLADVVDDVRNSGLDLVVVDESRNYKIIDNIT